MAQKTEYSLNRLTDTEKLTATVQPLKDIRNCAI
jgi:hypothetical protein